MLVVAERWRTKREEKWRKSGRQNPERRLGSEGQGEARAAHRDLSRVEFPPLLDLDLPFLPVM